MALTPAPMMPKADPALVAQHQAAADAFKAKNWGPNGTANGQTPAQNLAAVINQPGNPVAATPTPYISGVLSQAAKDTQAQQTPKPQGTFNPPSSAGDNPAPVPVAASNSTPAPMSQGSFPGQLTNAQIQAEAEARIAKQIASAQTAAAGALTGAKNAYDYTNQTNRDNRTLSNSMFNETHNPFTGQTGYAEANIARSNNLEDTGITNNYNAQVGQINQKLQDILTAAPGDQQAMIDQLTKQERDYGLQVGALTGQLNGQNTMQQNQNNFNNGIAQGNLTGNYTGPTGNQGQGTMSAQSISPSTGGNNMGWQGQGGQQQGVQTLAAQQLATQQQGQNFNQNMQTQQFAYTQARDAIKDKQYQQQFDMDNQKYGLDYALKQATLNNQITNDQAQRAIGYMNANTSQQQANTSASNANWAQNPNNPDNLYKQSEIAKNNAATPKSTDYKTDPNFSQDVAHLKASPADAAKLDSNPQPFIDAYGYDGYLALRKAAGLD